MAIKYSYILFLKARHFAQWVVREKWWMDREHHDSGSLAGDFFQQAAPSQSSRRDLVRGHCAPPRRSAPRRQQASSRRAADRSPWQRRTAAPCEQGPAHRLTLHTEIKQKEFTGQAQTQPKGYPDAHPRPGPAPTRWLQGAQVRRGVQLASRRFHCGKL